MFSILASNINIVHPTYNTKLGFCIEKIDNSI